MEEYLKLKKLIEEKENKVAKLKKELKETEAIILEAKKQTAKLNKGFPYPAHFSTLKYEYKKLKEEGKEAEFKNFVKDLSYFKDFNIYAQYEIEEFVKKLINGENPKTRDEF